MELKDLEGKALVNLSDEERGFIADEYLKYFDTLAPRERALGYCVVYCGISALHVGALDVGFRVIDSTDQHKVEYSLWIGANELHVIDDRFETVLFNYLQSDERILKVMGDDSYVLPHDKWLRFPLFAPKIHGKTDRLHDCRTFLANCGKAIGFNAKRVILHKLRNSPYFVHPMMAIGGSSVKFWNITPQPFD